MKEKSLSERYYRGRADSPFPDTDAKVQMPQPTESEIMNVNLDSVETMRRDDAQWDPRSEAATKSRSEYPGYPQS